MTNILQTVDILQMAISRWKKLDREQNAFSIVQKDITRQMSDIPVWEMKNDKLMKLETCNMKNAEVIL